MTWYVAAAAAVSEADSGIAMTLSRIVNDETGQECWVNAAQAELLCRRLRLLDALRRTICLQREMLQTVEARLTALDSTPGAAHEAALDEYRALSDIIRRFEEGGKAHE